MQDVEQQFYGTQLTGIVIFGYTQFLRNIFS